MLLQWAILLGIQVASQAAFESIETDDIGTHANDARSCVNELLFNLMWLILCFG